MVEVTIEPQPELSVSGTDGERLVVALDEIHVVPCPVVHLDVWGEPEEERLPGAVEVVGHLECTGRQSTEYIVLSILNDEEDGTLNPSHLAVHGVEREAVLGGAEHKGPHVTFGPGGEVPTQLFAMILGQYLSDSIEIWEAELKV